MSKIDWQLIQKLLAGNLSDSERKLLEKWSEKDKERQKFINNVAHFYNTSDHPAVDEQDINQAWQKFIERHHTSTPVIKKFNNAWLWRIAASILIITGLWMLQFSEDDTTIKGESNHTIVPGESKAYLILSDGSKVSLTNQLKPTQIVDKEISVKLDSSGISYENTSDIKEIQNHTIQIPQGGFFCMTLSDNTKVWLNAESSFTFPVSFSGEERKVALSGEAFFEVQPGSKPFIVEVNQMKIRVLGTSFNIYAYSNEPAVTTLVSGKVQVAPYGVSTCTLCPGEQAVWEEESNTITVNTVNVSLYTLWKDGKFIFRDTPLAEIMRTLSRWYKMTYEFVDNEAKDLNFYGIIDKYCDINELLAQFQKTGLVEFKYDQNHISIYKKGMPSTSL